MRIVIASCFMLFASQCWGFPGTRVYEEQFDDFVILDNTPPCIHYSQELVVPFSPVAGAHYWISVQAIYLEQPSNFWYWNRCPNDENWGFEGAFVSASFGVPVWTLLSDALGTSMNLSFVLRGEGGAEKWLQSPTDLNSVISNQTPTILAEAADDFYCGNDDPIVSIEWWGYYISPDPDSFIIRFYEEFTAATQENSWSVLKTLY
jgi:hypothetical protein